MKAYGGSRGTAPLILNTADAPNGADTLAEIFEGTVLDYNTNVLTTGVHF